MADKKKYQVFISSTFSDLKKERKVLKDHLLVVAKDAEVSYVPVGMETFLSVDKALPEYLKDLIDFCDYYVVIVAGRYGSTNKQGVSWTELEFKYAASTNIPVLAFFKSGMGDYTQQLNDFMDQIREKTTPRPWEDANDLKAQVYASLIGTKTPRPGWIRADDVPTDTETTQKLQRAQQRLETLKAERDKLAVDLHSLHAASAAEKEAL